MLGYKKHHSRYVLQHFVWARIDFDREKLIKFMRRLKYLKRMSVFFPQYRRERDLMVDILAQYDEKRIKALLDNDENTSRLCFIEKWSRVGAIEIAVNGKYTKETYQIISNLPINDYQLVVRRIQELLSVAQNLTTQDDTATGQTPGL